MPDAEVRELAGRGRRGRGPPCDQVAQRGFDAHHGVAGRLRAALHDKLHRAVGTIADKPGDGRPLQGTGGLPAKSDSLNRAGVDGGYALVVHPPIVGRSCLQ